MTRRQQGILTVSAITAVLLCGCTSTPAGDRAGSRGASSTQAQHADGTRVLLTASDVIRGLQERGLSIVRPIDATAQMCPEAGCTQAIVTDRMRVKSFASSREARRYADAHGGRQVATVVVTFGTTVSPAERERYWSAIAKRAG